MDETFQQSDHLLQGKKSKATHTNTEQLVQQSSVVFILGLIAMEEDSEVKEDSEAEAHTVWHATLTTNTFCTAFYS